MHTKGLLRPKGEDVVKKSPVLLRMKGVCCEWLPSLTGPVPLMTKERRVRWEQPYP